MRVDYFLDANKFEGPYDLNTDLSMIEINTFGCGGTGTPSKIVELHK